MTPGHRATLWLLAMCGVWGSSFFTMELGRAGLAAEVGERAAPSAFLFLRFLASAALLPVLLPRAVRDLSWRSAGDGLLLFLPFYAGFLLQLTGLGSTTPTVSAFITNLSVAVTPLLGALFFRERPGWTLLAGGAVALGGVWVLTDPAGGGLGTGELLTAACAVAFALQIQLTNILTRRSSPEAVTLVMFLAATAVSGGTLLAMGVSPAALARGLTARHVGWTVAYTAVFCSVVAITVMNRFQREIPATRAAVLYTLEPVFAAAFAAAFVGEPMTPRKIAGGTIIVVGNLLCELFHRATQPRRR